MSVMADKNAVPPSQQQMPPWQYNMYNMYANPYMFPGYGSNPYYQYYARVGYMGGPMGCPPQMRGFTPAGHLQPFSGNQPPPPQSPAPPGEEQKQDKNDDLPPLPPGPPPPMPQQNSFNSQQNKQQDKETQQILHAQQEAQKALQAQQEAQKVMQAQQQAQKVMQAQQQAQKVLQAQQQAQKVLQAQQQAQKVMQAQQVLQQAQQHIQQQQQQRFFQPQNSGGPIRFNMNTARARINLGKSPFTQERPQQNQKRKNKKKNKQQQHQQQQQLQQQQQMQQQMMNRMMMEEDKESNCEDEGAPPLPPPPSPPPPPPPNDLPKPPPPPPPPSISVSHLEEWPEPLKDYVNRCYAKCSTHSDKDRVGFILKGKILRATNDGSLWIKDWNNEPLPVLESEINQIMLKDRLGPTVSNNLNKRLGPPPSKQRSRSRSKSKSRSPSSSPRKRRSSKRSYRSSSRSRSSDSSSSTSSDENYISFSKSRKSSSKRGGSSSSRPGKKNNFRNNRDRNFGGSGPFAEVNTKKEVLDKRAARFSGGGKGPRYYGNGGSNGPASNPLQGLQLSSTVSRPGDDEPEFDLSSCHVVGTCRDIEKPYLRLTSAPEAAQVRPPDVLVHSLSNVKEKWVQTHDYHYVCEQLKSIRQDLTVQGIRDTFTLQVYETHARIALEKGDHAEFNQCQSQLKLLYQDIPDSPNKLEFTAYRLLYYIFTQAGMDVVTLMGALSTKEKSNECISHAILVTKAWLNGSYHRLLKLYNTAPRMASYVMDWFLPRERKLALKIIIKAYRPTIPIDFLTSELAFETDSLCSEFLAQFGLVYADKEQTKIDCKASTPVMSSV